MLSLAIYGLSAMIQLLFVELISIRIDEKWFRIECGSVVDVDVHSNLQKNFLASNFVSSNC